MPETNPIKPTNTVTSPTPVPQPQQPTQAALPKNQQAQQPNQATGRTYLASRGFAEGKELLDFKGGKKKPSSLQKQVFDTRFDRDYRPLEIMFLTGRYAGKTLDLGFNILDFSESQSADWSDQQGDTIRVGANFKNISTRTFNASVEYSSLNEDVRQLAEAIAHTQEITDRSWTPPLLRIFVGGTTISPAVCTSFDLKYDEPLPGKHGFRHGVANLSFKLIGGQGSPHELAPPLLSTATYLESWADNISDLDRAKFGEITRAKQLLADCLGEEGSNRVADLIKNNQLNNTEELLKVPARTFLQMVAAGMVKEATKDPRIEEKIRRDLALITATDRAGSNPVYVRELAESLYSGSSTNLPASLTTPRAIASEISTPDKDGNQTLSTKVESKSEFDLIKTDYDVASEALLKQQLEPNSPIFDRRKFPTASQNFLRSFSCGIALRRAGAPSVASITASEAMAVAGINEAIANPKLKDKELIELFGLDPNTPETVLRQLRNGGPYSSREEFLSRSSPNRQGISSYVMWQNFDSFEAKMLGALNQKIADPETKDEDLKQIFQAQDDEVVKIRNGGKPFQSKQEFLEKLANGDTPSLGRGNKLWENYRVWHLQQKQ